LVPWQKEVYGSFQDSLDEGLSLENRTKKHRSLTDLRSTFAFLKGVNEEEKENDEHEILVENVCDSRDQILL